MALREIVYEDSFAERSFGEAGGVQSVWGWTYGPERFTRNEQVFLEDLGGTATAGVDYLLEQAADGSPVITILDDDEREGPESFTFRSTQTRDWTQGDPEQHERAVRYHTKTITIVDDDDEEDCQDIRDDIAAARTRVDRVDDRLEGVEDIIRFHEEGLEDAAKAAGLRTTIFVVETVLSAKFAASAFVGGLIVMGVESIIDLAGDEDGKTERQLDRLEKKIPGAVGRVEKRYERIEKRLEREIGENLDDLKPGEFDIDLPRNLEKGFANAAKNAAKLVGKWFDVLDYAEVGEAWGDAAQMRLKLKDLKQDRKDIRQELRDERAELRDLRDELDACLAGHDDMLLL